MAVMIERSQRIAQEFLGHLLMGVLRLILGPVVLVIVMMKILGG